MRTRPDGARGRGWWAWWGHLCERSVACYNLERLLEAAYPREDLPDGLQQRVRWVLERLLRLRAAAGGEFAEIDFGQSIKDEKGE